MFATIIMSLHRFEAVFVQGNIPFLCFHGFTIWRPKDDVMVSGPLVVQYLWLTGDVVGLIVEMRVLSMYTWCARAHPNLSFHATPLLLGVYINIL